MNALSNLTASRGSGIVIILVVLLAACREAESEKSAPTAELQLAQPTIVIETGSDMSTTEPLEDNVPQVQQKENSTTGIPEIDNLIAIVLRNDTEEKVAQVRFSTAGCTNVMGLGGPPKCRGDQEEGTPIDYFPALGPGEGSIILPENIEGLLDFQVESAYAAYRRSDKPITNQLYAPGTYGLIFTSSPEEQSTQYIVVHANDDGQIVRLDYLPWKPDELIEKEAGQLLILPLEETDSDGLD